MAADLLGDLRGVARGRAPRNVGISARVTLSVHALNNEGSRNNATIPRQVNVATADGMVQANAISGDTLKHAFADYLRGHAQDAGSPHLPLCGPCRLGDANRSNADPPFQELAKKQPASVEGTSRVLEELARRCVVDDVAGLLVTEGKRNAPRAARVHFGWQVGIPDRVRTGQYTHVKLVPGAGQGEAEADEGGGNLGQNIFTRPASSGDYALVVRAELDRVGVHDLTRRAVIPEEARGARVRATLAALYHTISAPDGAQTNTQLPHLHGARGAVSVSFTSAPAAIVSALQPDFVAEMEAVAGAFDGGAAGQVVIPFASVGELGRVLDAVAALFSGEGG